MPISLQLVNGFSDNGGTIQKMAAGKSSITTHLRRVLRRHALKSSCVSECFLKCDVLKR